MTDDTTAAAGASTDDSQLIISEELRAQHPVLIDLIVRSESMNLEERQYWVDILPVMTPDQSKQLQEILQNERDQLAAIDAKYAKEMEKIGDTASIQEITEERRQRNQERASGEEAVRSEEQQKAEDILKEIE